MAMTEESCVPSEITVALKRILPSSDLLMNFWNTPHNLLENKSPKELWKEGKFQRVLDFIESAKSGDMA